MERMSIQESDWSMTRTVLANTTNGEFSGKDEAYGNITISLLMNITMNQLGGASVIAKFHS